MRKILTLSLLILLLFPIFLSNINASGLPTGDQNVTLVTYFDHDNVVPTDLPRAYGQRFSMNGSLAFEEDYDFVFWIVNGIVRVDLPVHHEFPITENLHLRAIFAPGGETPKYAVIFMDSNGKFINNVEYVLPGASATTPIPAQMPAARPGFEIDGTNPWIKLVGSDSPSEINQHSIFVINYVVSDTPVSDVTINVTGGTGPSEPVSFNTIVTVEAPATFGTDVFAGWEENGVIVSYNPIYVFTALYDRDLTATYQDSVTTSATVTLSGPLGLRTDKLSYVGQFHLKEGQDLVEYGFIYHDSNVGSLTLDTIGVVKVQSNTSNLLTQEFITSFSNTSHITMRAYLVYRADGVNQIIYSEHSHYNWKLMIYEVYGGGGNSGATYKNDYIVLYNATHHPIDLTGYSVQYASATGSSWSVTSLNGTIAVGGYYLIQQAAGAGGTLNLPVPNAFGTIAMAASSFKVALVSSTTALTGGNPISNPSVIDFVGVGTADAFEGSAATTAATNTQSVRRKAFLDTNDNGNDFELVITDLSDLTNIVVDFDSKGGSAVASYDVMPNAVISPPTAPTKENNHFDGWYVDELLTEAYVFSTPVTASFTLYAKWLPTVVVSFESNGGSPVTSQNVVVGGKASVPTPPTKAEYTFAGWFEDVELTTAYDFDSIVTIAVTLYAKWDESSGEPIVVLAHSFNFGTSGLSGYAAGSFSLTDSVTATTFTVSKDGAQLATSTSSPHPGAGNAFMVIQGRSATTPGTAYAVFNLGVSSVQKISFDYAMWSSADFGRISQLTKAVLQIRQGDEWVDLIDFKSLISASEYKTAEATFTSGTEFRFLIVQSGTGDVRIVIDNVQFYTVSE